MNRLNIGVSLLVLVVAILVIAPTVVFYAYWGTEAVLHHWAWVIFLAGLMMIGVTLVFLARARPDQPLRISSGTRRRLRLGLAAFGLMVGILVFAPTIAFGEMFGLHAVLAYWASVVLLAAMTLGGLYLVFTAKGASHAE